MPTISRNRPADLSWFGITFALAVISAGATFYCYWRGLTGNREAAELAYYASIIPTVATATFTILAELLRPRRRGDMAESDRGQPHHRETTSRVGKKPATFSDGYSELLLAIARHTHERKGLYEELSEDLDPDSLELQYQRIDVVNDRLEDAIKAALRSPAIVDAFARAGYRPDELRQMNRGSAWHHDVSDAVFYVRWGLSRPAQVDGARLA